MTAPGSKRAGAAVKPAFVRPDTLTEKTLVAFKWMLIVLIVLVLAWAFLAWTKWFPRTTDVQRKALAILAEPPSQAVGERNAFAAIWLWQYDIPAAETESVAQADLARFRASATDPRHAFKTSAEGRFRKDELPAHYMEVLCPADVDDCLAAVRGHLVATRELLAGNAGLLERARAISGYDHYRNGFPPDPRSPLPPFGGLGMLLLGDAALQFVDGDRDGGLERACTVARGWRQLALHADSRVMQAIGASYYIATSRLVAGMRAELPADASVPATCGAVFAPMPDAALSACDAMKSDFQRNAVLLRTIDDPQGPRHGSAWSGMLGRLLGNGRAAVAFSAPLYASSCTDDAAIEREALRIDHAASITGCGVEGVLFDPVGCILVQVGDPRRRAPNAALQNMQRMNRLMRATFADGAAAGAVSLPAGVTRDGATQALRIARAFDLAGELREFVVPEPGSRVR